MIPLDICIFLLQAAGGLIEWHGVAAAERMLINALNARPDLPWKIAIQGLANGDTRFEWAVRILAIHTIRNDGNAA